jgi:hypothetical protein
MRFYKKKTDEGLIVPEQVMRDAVLLLFRLKINIDVA